MILIAQQAGDPRHAETVSLLIEAGHPTVVVPSPAEAFDLMGHLAPDVVLLDLHRIHRCPHVLCSWVQQNAEGSPSVVGLAHIPDEHQRAQCSECITLLHPHTAPATVARTVGSLAEARMARNRASVIAEIPAGPPGP